MTALDSFVWEQIPGLAHELSIGADGSMWCLGLGDFSSAGYSIHRWNAPDWEHVAGAAIKIAAAPDGSLWTIDRQQRISRLTAQGWEPLPGLAREIACGANGAVWCLSASDYAPGGASIHIWNEFDWEHVDGAAVKIGIATDGTAWIVNSAGQIFRRSGEGWELMPGLASEIACGNSGFVCCLSASASPIGEHSIHAWNGADWDHISGNAVKIAAGTADQLLITDSLYRIYRAHAAAAV